MARFEREARLLASLDHPNIGAIYGLEESNGTRSLILALIEGPTLADRIAAGPIPLDEAIHIAQQIAEALEYAHDRGVIHRDLKPANVKITPESAVKVLDFGLAKALTGESDTACRRVAQRDCGAALHRNLLELAIGEEPDPFAHRRKEGGFSALRARQRRYLALIQQARVEEHLAVRAAQRESQARAVG
jgi:serine/threonine protein kinase